MREFVLGSENLSPLVLDVLNPTPEDFIYLKSTFKIPDIFIDDCMDPEHLPKLEKSDSIVFVIVRAYDEQADPLDNDVQTMTRKLALFVGKDFLAAIHRKELPFLDKAFAEIKKCGEVPSLQVMMLDILSSAVETFYEPLERAENEIHRYENSILKNVGGRQDWAQIFNTKSRLMVIKRMLWHTQNTMQKFVPYSDANLSEYQDLKEEMESLQFFTDSLLDNLTNLLNIQISLASNSTNEVIRVLTLFSVVFMPLTFIVGIYGMNFKDMPELNSRYGYAGVWGVMIATAVALYLWFRHKGWLK
jgi:magnesium transporter